MKNITTIFNSTRGRLFTVIALGLFMVFNATAGTGGTEFDTLYTALSGWLDGSPGKILATLSLMGAFFFSIVRPNFTATAASVIFMFIFAQGTAFIDGILGAAI